MDREQEEQAYSLGMWIFLGSELMLFGGLFLAYSFARFHHSAEFVQGSLHLDYRLGAVNTAVLLTSSTVMAFAVDTRRRRLLLLTALLGVVFLGVKGYEWSLHSLGEVKERLFFFFYYTLTGLHAFHLTLGVVAVLFFACWPRNRNELMMLGLYWHLVDLLWFFLYPLLYLVGSLA